jgi:hypothetical protein
MTAYQIQSLTRICQATQQPLRPGERFVSALVADGGQLVRHDYAADAWTGPPAGVVAYWTGRVPAEGQPRPPVVNDELLVECFDRLDGAADVSQQNFRYVLALLLMRRKRFRFEEVRKAAGQDLLVLKDVRTGQRHTIADPRLSAADREQVQDEVFRVLGWA